MTGARIGEVGQMRPCDVLKRDGILVLDFDEEQRKSPAIIEPASASG